MFKKLFNRKGETSNRGGIGFLGLLAILFIALKLMGVINWSWFYVLLPLTAIPLIIILFTGVAFLLATIAYILEN